MIGEDTAQSRPRRTLRFVAAWARIALPRIERKLKVPRDVEDRLVERILAFRAAQRASAGPGEPAPTRGPTIVDDVSGPRPHPTLRFIAALARVELPQIERTLKVPGHVVDRLVDRILTFRHAQRASAGRPDTTDGAHGGDDGDRHE